MDIVIENLWPTETTVPIDGTDALGRYVGVELDGEYQTTIHVPQQYFVGQDIFLVFEDASDGEDLNHQWQATVTLNATSTEVFVSEVTSPAVEDTPTERIIQISTDGAIDGTNIAVGDIFFISLKRIAASADEDPNVIRIYTFIVRVESAEDSESGCYGDVGVLIDEARDLMNDANKDDMTDAQILRAFNSGLRYLGQHGYLRQESALDITANVGTIDLMANITGFSRAYSCRYTGANFGMSQASSWEHFMQLSRLFASGEEPLWWFILSNTLHFVPIPTSSVSSGLYLLNAYRATDLGCYSDYTLPFPMVHGDVLVARALWVFHNRFFTDDREFQIQQWWSKFLQEARDLLGQTVGEVSVRPG